MSSYTFPLPGWSGDIQLHHGTDKGASDLFAPRGWPVVSITSGVVEYVGSDAIGGNNVGMKGDDGLEYYYAHFDSPPTVSNKQRVTSGLRIGSVGDTGNAKGTGPHLHIGIGPTIAQGAGAHGGAGDNFDAVDFLRKVHAGQTPNISVVPGGLPSTGEGGGNPLGFITDPVAEGLGQLMKMFFGAFTSILRGE